MVTLVCLVGIGVCVAFRRQAPQPLTIGAAALAAWVLLALIESAAETAIYGAFGSRPQGGLLVSNALTFVGFLTGTGRAVALGGLIWAVLCDRKIDFQKPGL